MKNICEELSIYLENSISNFFDKHIETDLGAAKEHLANCPNCWSNFSEKAINFLEKNGKTESFICTRFMNIVKTSFGDTKSKLYYVDSIMRKLSIELMKRTDLKAVSDFHFFMKTYSTILDTRWKELLNELIRRQKKCVKKTKSPRD